MAHLAGNPTVNSIGAISNLPANVDVNSGVKGASTPRMVLATDDIPTALVNTNLAALIAQLVTKVAITAFTTKTVAASTSAADLVAASAGRKYVRFTNHHATINMFVGTTGIIDGTTADANGGILIPPLQSYTPPADLAPLLWRFLSASGTPVMGVISGT